MPNYVPAKYPDQLVVMVTPETARRIRHAAESADDPRSQSEILRDMIDTQIERLPEVPENWTPSRRRGHPSTRTRSQAPVSTR